MADCNKPSGSPGYEPCKRIAGHAGPCMNAEAASPRMELCKREAVQPWFGSCTRTLGHTGPCAHPQIGPEGIIPKVTIQPQAVLTGGRVNYYLVRVEHPQREDQPAYTAECEDIGEALGLDPNEMNIFKEIWRSANARKGNGKPDHKALYGAEKIVHYAGRILRKLKLTKA